ncbi:MAG: hypothetical protein HRK26_05590 [Rickettsiaceae bacterium H1]|nr:hypothetical protein [Rickettsiaceae bacterium H1]
MKILLLSLLIPYIFFKPDAIDEVPYVKNDSNGIFKVRPKDSGGLKVKHTNKQVYNLIASSPDIQKDM